MFNREISADSENITIEILDAGENSQDEMKALT